MYVEICTHSLDLYIFGKKHCNMFHANKEFVCCLCSYCIYTINMMMKSITSMVLSKYKFLSPIGKALILICLYSLHIVYEKYRQKDMVNIVQDKIGYHMNIFLISP